MRAIPKECSIRHVIIRPSEIHFLRFILEAYEGIAIATTLDPRLGLIKLSIAPGCEEETARILTAEGGRLQLQEVSFPTSEQPPFAAQPPVPGTPSGPPAS